MIVLAVLIMDGQEIFIESKESQTTVGAPVFNKIKWIQFKDKDVWMMNQSHHGSFAEKNKWDRLAIVIDKNRSPKVARFYQLESGPLEWNEKLTERPFRVSCFICHNNGPRNIRPNYDSVFAKMSFRDRLKINWWNLRMKFYGRVVVDKTHDVLDQKAKIPFRFHSDYENEPLKVAVCMGCHKESGFFARGVLVRQQALTIKFMLESGQMPPPGFSFSSVEKQQLEMFLDGF